MPGYPAELDPFRRCFERASQIAGEPRYRLQLAQRYSYVLPESHLLRAVASCAPLVEIGAGTGYWAYMLEQLDADVVAYDRAPVSADLANRYHARTWEWHEVMEGTEAVLARHSDRSLFVCWPPLFSSLWRVLDFFFGDTVVYVGDGGERTARLAGLDRDYCEIERLGVTAMDAALGWPAQLTIWRRRAGRRNRGGTYGPQISTLGRKAQESQPQLQP